ncbi:unnamed protein product [Jaminaea pallidilutea]
MMIFDSTSSSLSLSLSLSTSTDTLSSLDEKPPVPASASSKELSTLCDPLVNPSSTSKAIAHLTPFAFAGTDHFDADLKAVYPSNTPTEPGSISPAPSFHTRC